MSKKILTLLVMCVFTVLLLLSGCGKPKNETIDHAWLGGTKVAFDREYGKNHILASNSFQTVYIYPNAHLTVAFDKDECHALALSYFKFDKDSPKYIQQLLPNDVVGDSDNEWHILLYASKKLRKALNNKDLVIEANDKMRSDNYAVLLNVHSLDNKKPVVKKLYSMANSVKLEKIVKTCEIRKFPDGLIYGAGMKLIEADVQSVSDTSEDGLTTVFLKSKPSATLLEHYRKLTCGLMVPKEQAAKIKANDHVRFLATVSTAKSKDRYMIIMIGDIANDNIEIKFKEQNKGQSEEVKSAQQSVPKPAVSTPKPQEENWKDAGNNTTYKKLSSNKALVKMVKPDYIETYTIIFYSDYFIVDKVTANVESRSKALQNEVGVKQKYPNNPRVSSVKAKLGI